MGDKGKEGEKRGEECASPLLKTFRRRWARRTGRER